ncbi:kelch domain-containing protein 10-like [Mizuhopecten yessoensis]|uniref:Kelch domain-containing protein 10 n=2 Tax=Mizuhopecten yessoensis TaxID=6573 RepID=A0A210Q4A5_MIZYE|nr:kelch domain-containing protein 10-like [Mizuhopecten yessoensis]OWF43573.1 Kelch domain-containing protein 10 [Mizuhopecten yessoensis]
MAGNLLAFQRFGPTQYDDESSENLVEHNVDYDFLYPRSGHRVAVDEKNMYVLGGYNPRFWDVENTEDTYYPLFKELWQFNFSLKKWTLLQTEGNMPIELASHTAVRCGRNLLCFGGTGVPFGECSSNQLHICNLDTLKWRQLNCTGEHPQKKYGHSMNVVGHYLYIVGGTSGFVYNMDIHQLDLRTATWTHLEADNQKYIPESRYRHEVASDGTRLYLFGGGTASTSFGFDKMPAFHFERCMWDEIKTKPDPKNGYPTPRKCHSCVYYEKGAYICGGFDSHEIFSDIWKLCLVTYTWTKLSASLHIPVYFHAADVTKEGCMYVFGGVSRIDTIRTNAVQRIWLRVPALDELCWDYMCRKMDVVKFKQDKKNLLGLGVPMHFVDRLS